MPAGPVPAGPGPGSSAPAGLAAPEPPAAVRPAPAGQPLPVWTEQLCKVYPGRGRGVLALDRLDLRVQPGEFLGLLGPNGAGKSTTIGMLTTRVLPTSGRAEIAGVDVVRHPVAVKRLIGVVPQTNTLDRQLTVVENLEFHGRFFGLPPRVARARAAELLEWFHLGERARAEVATLSGGMAQRLMVARALVHQPAVLFLDEPMSGIDPQARLALHDLLRGLRAGGQTILLTTHDMQEADTLCDRVVVIDRGRVLADGSPEELKRSLAADTVLTLTVSGGDPDGLCDDARALDGVRRAELDRRDGAAPVLRVLAARPTGLLTELVLAALRRGVRVDDATSQPPTLQAVFLSLTGRDLRE